MLIYTTDAPQDKFTTVSTTSIQQIDWTVSLENRFANHVAYINFSRAFDTVCHPKLLHKLKSFGIEGVLHQWIGDFLTERSHCTRVNNVYSSFEWPYS